jgi:hypothetical protein
MNPTSASDLFHSKSINTINKQTFREHSIQNFSSLALIKMNFVKFLTIFFRKLLVHPWIFKIYVYINKEISFKQIFDMFSRKKNLMRKSPGQVWCASWPRTIEQKCHQIYSTVKFVEQNFHSPILSRNLYGRYP